MKKTSSKNQHSLLSVDNYLLKIIVFIIYLLLGCAMSNVYTFGPTFRAEISHTQKHLAEFWMIEPEIAFADINDCMNLAEDYLKFSIKYVLENNMSDLEFFDERVKKG